MVEHFSKWIELVALSQNSLELVTIAFLNCVLAHFRAHVEMLTNQGQKFFGSFKKL